MYKGINPAKGISIKVIEPSLSLSEAENTCQKGILSDIDKKKNPKQMEKCSILSDHVKYVQHDESDMLHKLNFDSLNLCPNEDLCIYYWVVELCQILYGTSGHTDLKDARLHPKQCHRSY